MVGTSGRIVIVIKQDGVAYVCSTSKYQGKLLWVGKWDETHSRCMYEKTEHYLLGMEPRVVERGDNGGCAHQAYKRASWFCLAVYVFVAFLLFSSESIIRTTSQYRFFLSEAHEHAQHRLAPSLWVSTSTTLSHPDTPMTLKCFREKKC